MEVLYIKEGCVYRQYICISFKILRYLTESRQQVGTVCAADWTEIMLTAAPNRPALSLRHNACLDAALHWESSGALIVLCLNCVYVCVCVCVCVYVCVPTANCNWLLLFRFKLPLYFFPCNSWCLTSFVWFFCQRFKPIPFRLGESCLVYCLA
jgi:hypothetical protein